MQTHVYSLVLPETFPKKSSHLCLRPSLLPLEDALRFLLVLFRLARSFPFENLFIYLFVSHTNYFNCIQAGDYFHIWKGVSLEGTEMRFHCPAIFSEICLYGFQDAPCCNFVTCAAGVQLTPKDFDFSSLIEIQKQHQQHEWFWPWNSKKFSRNDCV